MGKLKIALAALNQTPIAWKNNIENIKDALQQAANKNADILVLPELCLTGYGCEDLFLSEWIYKKTEKLVAALLAQYPKSTFTLGIPIQVNQKNYNGVLVAEKGKILGISLKQFLANDGLHYEKRWFNAWPAQQQQTIKFADQTVLVGDILYNIKGNSIGIEICRDAWMKEDRPAHRYIQQGAKIILNPSASHFAFKKTLIRENLGLSLTQNTNSVFVLVNLLGNEAGKVIFDGDIQVHQNGKLKYKAERLSLKKVDFHCVDVDTENPNNTTENKISDWFFKNEEFTLAATVGLFDYLRKSKAKGFVLSLSGGADSALCAVLVAQMVRRLMRHYSIYEIGNFFNLRLPDEAKDWPTFKKRDFIMQKLLITVYQSTENSGDETYKAAKELAESIGASFYQWSVNEEVELYTQKTQFILGRGLKWDEDDIALQNIQSRVRAPGIWMLANVSDKILLTTSNRSEASVGYATMDGDTAGSLAPIAGVDKHFIRQYLYWAQQELNFNGLKLVNNQSPTAELRPADHNQTDEQDLMPYFILNKIEEKAIGQWKSPQEVFEELIKELPFPHGKIKTYIAKFYRLWSINQWKRERYATSFHYDNYNVDPGSYTRFPIISGNFNEEIDEMMKA